MTPELKRSIIKCLPEFFSLSDEKQQRYKSTLSSVDYFKVKQYVVKQLFGINIINNSMDENPDNQC